MAWRIGHYSLDPETRELRHDGNLIAIEARVFDFLVMLTANRDRVIGKEELISTVWSGRVVSDTAISSCLKSARAAIGDSGKQQAVIKTIHGNGYRFVADVTDGDESALQSGIQDPAARVPPALNLPADRRTLFGRRQLITDISRLVDENRLVSLLGIGGTGKTRLAVACGHALLTHFPDGVWFADLVPVSSAQGIDLAIAEAIGLTLTGDAPRSELSRIIHGRQLLLILDNCEHISELVAESVDDLLEQTKAPRILVTSRVPLDLADEYRVNVEPLTVNVADVESVDVTNSGGPAVQLFYATASRLGVPLNKSDSETIGSICTHLDGLPLAIELAAAQLRHFSLSELADRLDKRFDFLAGRVRAGKERQASLHNVLADTWEMLDSSERPLLSQLAVFPGLFSVTDIEELTAADDENGAAVSHVFGRLIDKSLIKREGKQWRLLETVRLFVQRESDDDARRKWANNHADWCLAIVGDSVQAHCYSHSLAAWCTNHYNDLRVARTHLVEVGRHDDANRLTAGQGLAFHRDRGTRATVMLRELDDHVASTADPSLIARLYLAGAMSAMAIRSPLQLASNSEAALKAARDSGDASIQAIALVLTSWSTVFRDVDGAIAQVREAAALARGADDQATLDFADSYLAWHMSLKRDYPEAIDVVREVIARADEGELTETYPLLVAGNALAAIIAIDEPQEASDAMATIGDTQSELTFWSSKLLSAYCLASLGRYDDTAAICVDVNNDLARTGISGLPDLLIPAACMAHRRGDKGRAMAWLRAVKEAGRPTQSFQMTIAYRRLSETVGLSKENPVASRSLEDVGADALQWMLQSVG